jgi:hypothetical protein
MRRVTLASVVFVSAMAIGLLLTAGALAATNVPSWWIDHGTPKPAEQPRPQNAGRQALPPGAEPFIVHMSMKDANSGIATPGIEYRLVTWVPPIYVSWQAGDEVELWVNPLTHGTDGQFPLEYRATDKAGNTTLDTVQVKIDTRGPATDGASGWVNGLQPYVLTAVDQVPGSGVAATLYRVDQKTPWSVNQAGTVAPTLATSITWTAPKQGELHTIDFASVDAALPFDYTPVTGVPSWHFGNWELDVLNLLAKGSVYNSRAVQLDVTAPTVSVSGADDAWHSAPVTLAFSATDVGSGVGRIEWSLDGTNWTAGNSATVSKNGVNTVSYRAVDKVGLVSATQTVTVKVSTSPPVVTGGGDVSVKKGQKAAFSFKVTTVTPTVEVTIQIRSKDGRTLSTHNFVNVPANADASRSFRIDLPKGKYDIRIGATDLAGNVQVPRATGTLTVH